MKNILTILRRDLSAYFTSPIGYIFMVVFLIISVGLYMTAFFTFPTADMRMYFANLPIMLCIFIPAITMRIWAEERKENTWELLLTFPMRASELVLGKFLAAFVFLAITLAGTVTVPIMLASLGNPDNGAILGGYLGTLLLGGFFLAIGIFFSGFCKDQIISFVVSLLACFLVFLLGTDFIAGYIDGVVGGLGSMLSQLVGMIRHYTPFTRGVIEVGDVLYFLIWIVILLWLNIFYIDGRNRPHTRVIFAGAIIICLVIGLLFNWLTTGSSIKRFDLTEDKSFTVSPASKSILSKLDTPVQVKLYITPKDKMPTSLKTLEQDVAAKLDELRVASGNKIEFNTIYLEAANVISAMEDMNQAKEEEKEGEETEEEAVEKRMLDKGVTPFSVQAIAEDEMTNKLIYSSIGVAYKTKTEEIIPQIMPQTLPELEYRLISTIYKLTQENPAIVALVAPKEAVNIPPEQRRMLEQMGQPIPDSEDPYSILERVLRSEKYRVERVDLSQESPLPKEYDCVVVVNPRSLNERQRWELNRALVSGKPVILAAQNYEWDYRVNRDKISLSKMEEKPEVNPLLEQYGVTIDNDILMDVNHVTLTVSGGNPLAQALGLGQSINLPTHIVLKSTSMDPDTSITNRLSAVFYLWGSALKLNEETLQKNNLEAKVLMRSSNDAWLYPADKPITQDAFEPPSDGKQAYPLMAMVTGTFPDAYKDQPRPAWPETPQEPGKPPKPPRPDEPEPGPVQPAPGKLVLIGGAELFKDDFLKSAPGNLDLFMNSVDAMALTEDIVHVRGGKPIDRTISMPSATTRSTWKIVNYALVNILIAVVGVVTLVVRRQSRAAYAVAYAAKRNS